MDGTSIYIALKSPHNTLQPENGSSNNSSNDDDDDGEDDEENAYILGEV